MTIFVFIRKMGVFQENELNNGFIMIMMNIVNVISKIHNGSLEENRWSEKEDVYSRKIENIAAALENNCF